MKAVYRPGRARVTRTSELLLASLAFVIVSPTFAQEQSQSAEEGDVIVVTGSRIAREVVDASTPIAIIPA
jgi:outer membrane receptor for ferrienterochelin and colicin